ncbi:MAG TPA: SpoIID/LytB domain-containing protein, partial [Myxococcaceae bacterium]|nr:SpoIID/LytB domain-containing protein [Myxococcaceae bacterium]
MSMAIGRSQPLCCLAVVFGTCFSFASPAAAQAGTPKAKGGALELRVRDAATGYAIPGAIVIDFGSSGSVLRSYRLPQSANLRTEVASGAHQLEISAPGRRPLRTQALAFPEQSMPITIWLDPVGPADELRGRTTAAPATSGLAVIQGFVVDAELGAPLSGARVLVGAAATQTDERGFFSLSLAVPIAPPDSVPEQASLRADTDGHETYLLLNMPLVEGESDLVIELHRGSGIRTEDGTHKLLRSPEELELSQSAPAAPEPEDAGGGPNDSSLVIAPPSSIRVGYNCSCTSCSTVEVMSLETYVKRGLPREWFASWLPHSLRAGAIAYRSYGAYYVEHPLRLDYDICNTTCCQVNGTSTSPSTNSATDLTAGILLQRARAVFRAEYSAE